ncbi:hypothetical protein Tco_1061377 [Tanacetum coccineum]
MRQDQAGNLGDNEDEPRDKTASRHDWSVRRIDFTEYAVLFGRIDTLFRLQRSIRCLSRRFDTSYPTGGYGISIDLPEQST